MIEILGPDGPTGWYIEVDQNEKQMRLQKQNDESPFGRYEVAFEPNKKIELSIEQYEADTPGELVYILAEKTIPSALELELSDTQWRYSL